MSDQMWTLVETEFLRQNYQAEGLSIKEIAHKLGRSPSSISNKLVQLGLKKKSGAGPPTKLTKEELKLMVRLKRAGLSNEKIGERLGVDGSTVSRNLRKLKNIRQKNIKK